MKNNKIHTDIKYKSIDGQFRPGQWIVERELCYVHGISRTPLRDALRRLISEGFLSLQKSKGYPVKKLSTAEIIRIFQAREAVECMPSNLACHDGTDEFIPRLKEPERELETLKNLAALTRNKSKRSIEMEKKSRDDHIELIKALIVGDENCGTTCMRNHLRAACREIVETFISDLKGEMKYITR